MGCRQSSWALDRANLHLRKGKHRTTAAIARTTSGSAGARLRNREYAPLHWRSVLLPSPDDLRPQTPPQVFPLRLPVRRYLARIRGNKLKSSSNAHGIQLPPSARDRARKKLRLNFHRVGRVPREQFALDRGEILGAVPES